MSEKKVSEKKVVRRSVAIALGGISIILVAALGVVAYMSYSSTSTTSVTSLQKQINDLNATYNSYVSSHSHTNSEYDNLNSIIELKQSTVVATDKTVSQANSQYYNFSLSANYAGYVVVTVESSTVAGTWVQVSYSSHGLNYNQAYTGSQAISVGNSAIFPILPSTVTIGVGNGLIFGSGATETVTITYYY
jgi:hypothetical protein